MAYLSSESLRANPWEPVRCVLYIFWLVQFWFCACLGLVGIGGLFDSPFDFGDVLFLLGVVVVDGLYIRQMHFYAMGKLEPSLAVKMQSVQCLAVGLLLVKFWFMMADQLMGAIAFIYTLPFVATFLLQLLVSIGVLNSSKRQELRSVQLSELSDEI